MLPRHPIWQRSSAGRRQIFARFHLPSRAAPHRERCVATRPPWTVAARGIPLGWEGSKVPDAATPHEKYRLPRPHELVRGEAAKPSVRSGRASQGRSGKRTKINTPTKYILTQGTPLYTASPPICCPSPPPPCPRCRSAGSHGSPGCAPQNRLPVRFQTEPFAVQVVHYSNKYYTPINITHVDMDITLKSILHTLTGTGAQRTCADTEAHMISRVVDTPRRVRITQINITHQFQPAGAAYDDV